MLITRISGAKLLHFFCFSKYSSDFISQRTVYYLVLITFYTIYSFKPVFYLMELLTLPKMN